MSKIKRSLLSVQQVVLVTVGVVVVLFALLNLDPVTIDLFFAQVETSVALLLLVPLLTGMLLGWVGGRLAARRKGLRLQAASREPTAELSAGDTAAEDEDWSDLDLDEIGT